MGPVVVVLVEPSCQRCSAGVLGGVEAAVGPAVGQGAVEAFDFPVGLWSIWPGSAVFDLAQALFERVRSVTRTVVGSILFVPWYRALRTTYWLAAKTPRPKTVANHSHWRPTRTVLLKGVDERGFVFYTNYDSRKGLELVENPSAALTFYWPELERQICVIGRVEKISREESEDYFKLRPPASRLAAWAANQPRGLSRRVALEPKGGAVAERDLGYVTLSARRGADVV